MAFDKEAAFSAALAQAEAVTPETPAPEAPAAPAAAADPAKPDPAKPADPPKPDRLTKSYEDLAREKAKLRQEKTDNAAKLERAARAEALLEAAEKGDAMSLLTAAKIPWNAAAKQVLDGKIEAKAPAAEPTAADKRIEALERELAQGRAQANRTAVLAKAQDLAKSDPKFKYVAGLGAHDQALNWLERYHAQTGELPGETLDESLSMALEAVENHLSREADRWRPLLGSGASSVSGVKPVVPPKAVSQQAGNTLTNDTGSGPKPAPGTPRVPRTDEDYRAEALKLLEAEGAIG